MNSSCSGGRHSITFWITWFPFWSFTHRRILPSSSWTINTWCSWKNSQLGSLKQKLRIKFPLFWYITRPRMNHFVIWCHITTFDTGIFWSESERKIFRNLTFRGYITKFEPKINSQTFFRAVVIYLESPWNFLLYAM